MAGIRWKDIALIRGGLTDALNSCSYERCAVTTNREKSADVIVAELPITLREGLNLY
ncbi:MAG: hypothetical protein J5510_02155 [Prevotella sp.]|nr:hypothetical protein [Prevotella sp.]